MMDLTNQRTESYHHLLQPTRVLANGQDDLHSGGLHLSLDRLSAGSNSLIMRFMPEKNITVILTREMTGVRN